MKAWRCLLPACLLAAGATQATAPADAPAAATADAITPPPATAAPVIPPGDAEAVAATPGPAAQREAAQQSFLRLMDEKRYAEAATTAAHIVELTQQLHTEPGLGLAAPLANLGTAQLQSGDLDSAQATYIQAIDLIERHDGIASTRLINPLTGLGEARLRAGLYLSAIEAYERALQVNHAASGFYNLEQIRILDGLSEAFLGLEKFDRADARQRSQVTIHRRHDPDDHGALAQAWQKLGRWYTRTGQQQAAQAAFQDARRVLRKDGGDYDPRMIDTLLGEAMSYESEGELPIAATVLKRALDLVDAQPVMDHARRAEVLVALGDLQIVARQPRAARQHYIDAWQALSGHGETLLAARDAYFARPQRIGGPRLPEVVDPDGKARPAAALGQLEHEQGLVVAALTVTAQGRATDARIIESTPPGLLDKQFLRALDGSAFRPAMIDGQPVDRPDTQFRHSFRFSPAGMADSGQADPATRRKGERIAYPEATSTPGDDTAGR
ncbi:MAG: TonB family protein [Gammaproteobacteria bacterium]|nr:TonB family protein [Gammaproteobacteria bacterium]